MIAHATHTHAPRRRVVVALHAGGAAGGAIEAGRVVARAIDAPLHGVLVWPTAISPAEVPRLLRLDPRTFEGMVIDVDVGDPAERFVDLACAQPVAFVVLSADEEGRDACGLGEIASRAMAGATAGAIVMRAGASLPRLARILVPLDGTPSTAAALTPAGELAKCAGASLDLVLIEDTAAAASDEPGAMTSPQYVDQPQHEWPAFSKEFTHRFMGAIAHCPEGVPTRMFVGAGDPASEILRFAKELDSDLITLVWQGHCDGEHGVVFRRVVRGSARPILVLRR